MPSLRCTVAFGAKKPSYQTEGAAGADVCAFLSEPVVLEPGCRCLIPTGLCFEIQMDMKFK